MYMKLGSKSDLRAEISESIVWYEALAPRPEVLRSFSDFYANDARWVFFLRKHKFSKIDLSHPTPYFLCGFKNEQTWFSQRQHSG